MMNEGAVIEAREEFFPSKRRRRVVVGLVAVVWIALAVAYAMASAPDIPRWQQALGFVAMAGVVTALAAPRLRLVLQRRPVLRVTAEGIETWRMRATQWREVERLAVAHRPAGLRAIGETVARVLPPPVSGLMDALVPANRIDLNWLDDPAGAAEALARHAPSRVFRASRIDDAPIPAPLRRAAEQRPTRRPRYRSRIRGSCDRTRTSPCARR